MAPKVRCSRWRRHSRRSHPPGNHSSERCCDQARPPRNGPAPHGSDGTVPSSPPGDIMACTYTTLLHTPEAPLSHRPALSNEASTRAPASTPTAHRDAHGPQVMDRVSSVRGAELLRLWTAGLSLSQ